MNIMELTRIVQEVAFAGSPTDQVNFIVDSISESLAVDVCSLYRLNDRQEMELLASHGLTTGTKTVAIPAGKGLVGLVVKSRHAVNIDDAANHPDYFYIPQISEEKFSSFCGVPLVRFGKVIGALVAQSRKKSKLNAESEAFLTTLASQLALIVYDLPSKFSSPSEVQPNIRIKGNKGAPGIGIGQAYVCIGDDLDDVVEAACDDIDATLAQWHELLNSVKQDIKSEQSLLHKNVSDSVSGIFDAYAQLLSDQNLIGKVEAEIRSGHWLPWAIKHSIQYFAELFGTMTDPYLKARCEDILHLGNKLYFAWRGQNPIDQIKDLREPIVLIGEHIDVSLIASVPADMLAGIVSFSGAPLSHTAILANALGVPAVMGVGPIKNLHHQQKVIVIGDEGKVIINPSAAVAAEYEKLLRKEIAFRKQLDDIKELPARTLDGVNLTLYTNTGLLADLNPGIQYGADGIGLYRTEIPFMVRESFPSEEDQFLVYQRVLQAYKGKPVYMRTLDIGGDKQLPYFPITGEENPALGWRGIRFTLDNIQLLMTQIRAMIRASEECDNLHILVPMVSSSRELNEFISTLDDACAQLCDEGIEFIRPKIGIMLEVPAAVAQLHFWREKIDFVSIGTNDLSQYLLAIDRNNTRVASRFDHVHPAVVHEIKRIVEITKKLQLPLSLCGEMASDPVAVALLMGLGLRTLSMNANKLLRIKWLIRSIDIQRLQEVADEVLQLDCPETIRKTIERELLTSGLAELLLKTTDEQED